MANQIVCKYVLCCFACPCSMLLAGNHSYSVAKGTSYTCQEQAAPRYEAGTHQHTVHDTEPAVLHAEVLCAIPSFLPGCIQPWMSGKAHKGEAGSTSGGSEDTIPLLSLPAPVLAT
jgi:hypothetical protein